MRPLLLAVVLALAAPPLAAEPPGWHGNWPRRAKVRFDNKTGGALKDFPATIRLTKEQVAGWKGGLRFVDRDGAKPLPYEIAWWDPERGAELHVLIPEIDASSDEDFIWLYAGRPGKPRSVKVSTIWRRSGHVAVYHLAETSGAYRDSADRHHSLRVQLGPRENTKGIADHPVADFRSDVKGQQGDLIDLGRWNVAGKAITLEAFFRTEERLDRRLISKSDGASDEDHTWMLNAVTPPGTSAYTLRYRQRTKERGTGSPLHGEPAEGTVELNRWYHAAASYDGASMRLFLDGKTIGSRTKTGEIAEDDRPIHIGNNPGTPDQHFGGQIDEVRISAVARSAGWLRATAAGLRGRFAVVAAFEARPERKPDDPPPLDAAALEAKAAELLAAARELESKGQADAALKSYEKAAALGEGPSALAASAACFRLMRDPAWAAGQAGERREAAARGLLSAARMFSQTSKAKAIERLEELLRDYPRSELVPEARRLLDELR